VEIEKLKMEKTVLTVLKMSLIVENVEIEIKGKLLIKNR
jgi:hypothetical protein